LKLLKAAIKEQLPENMLFPGQQDVKNAGRYNIERTVTV